MNSIQVTLSLTPEMQSLLTNALKLARQEAHRRIDSGEASYFPEQIGQLQWLITYIEHKIKDSR